MCKTNLLFNFRRYPDDGGFQPNCRLGSWVDERRNVGAETTLSRSFANLG